MLKMWSCMEKNQMDRIYYICCQMPKMRLEIINEVLKHLLALFGFFKV